MRRHQQREHRIPAGTQGGARTGDQNSTHGPCRRSLHANANLTGAGWVRPGLYQLLLCTNGFANGQQAARRSPGLQGSSLACISSANTSGLTTCR